jgi:cell division protein ZapA
MAQVNVTIAGKSFRMACDDGQEPHLVGLAQRVNAVIDQLRERFGEIGDQRLTVMAAITMADRSSESERRVKELEAEVAVLREAGMSASAERMHQEADVAAAIESVAARLESIAHRLNAVPEDVDAA